MGSAGLFVLDCSVSIGWVLQGQADDYSEAALDALTGGCAVTPQWWTIEVLNVLLALERRERIAVGTAVDVLRHLERLPIRVRQFSASVFELHALAARHELSSYDAVYRESALATGLLLATRDKSLERAAIDSGVGVWNA